VIVRVPGGNLRQAPDHAVPGGQVRGVEAGDQSADGVPAAAQVLGHLSLGYRCGGLGMLGIQRVHGLAAYLDRTLIGRILSQCAPVIDMNETGSSASPQGATRRPGRLESRSG
jgi:hypothetical protein